MHFLVILMCITFAINWLFHKEFMWLLDHAIIIAMTIMALLGSLMALTVVTVIVCMLFKAAF